MELFQYAPPGVRAITVALLRPRADFRSLRAGVADLRGDGLRKVNKSRAGVLKLNSAPTHQSGCPVKSRTDTDKSGQWRQESRRGRV